MLWVILEVFLSENGQKFVNKLFTSLGAFSEAKKLTMNAFHPQTNRQAEIYNKTLVTWHLLYIANNKQG